ncbi:hypothetical protein NQ314_013960 [Rhamnusium bicolor]|uniref:Bestrophin homolog n=1 Tax=Rhamnusium bicolor TaxID=1586634 RepID=A0AAV8X3H0_9CUCU|nr:hypothetical protein NQ314_013960 [Rhamnusium bicolor]
MRMLTVYLIFKVVSLALYVYFIAALLGRQFIPYADKSMQTKWEEPDMYFPFFTALQFCFYIGWLKVAEVLINPFGEDDDDIELNWLIDRHIKAGYMIVDEMHEEHPELLKDQYWDDVVPKELPYTVASEHYRREEPKGSAELYKVKTADAMYANLVTPKKSMLHDDMYADYESVDTPIVERRKSSNWFSRQISRTGMGSIRSASTAYSSGGLFTRHRGNSVYANPENGQLPGLPPQKMSIYDRLVGRKSGRSRNFKPNKLWDAVAAEMKSINSKFSGAAAMQVKNRPRIPTPDVTKEVVDRENRLAASVANVQNQMSPGLTLMSHQIPANYTSYPPGDVPVVQAFEPVKPVTPTQTLTLTEVHPEDEHLSSRCSNGSPGSEISHVSKDSIVSNMSNTTASITSKRSLEMHPDLSEGNALELRTPISLSPTTMDAIPDVTSITRIEMTPSLERTPSFIATNTEGASGTPSVSAPNSLLSLGSNNADGTRVRKISIASQNAGNSSPKREVYV